VSEEVRAQERCRVSSSSSSSSSNSRLMMRVGLRTRAAVYMTCFVARLTVASFYV